MAIQDVPTQCILTFRDRENTPAKTRFFLPAGGLANVDAQAVYTQARAMTTAIAALSDCQLVSMAVVFQGRDDVTAGTGEVERKGQFVFAVNGGSTYQTMIPGFMDSLLDSDRRSIAVAGAGVQAPVQAFIDALLNGPPSFNNGATNAAGLNLVRVVSGKKEHVRSLVTRRGRSG